MTHPVNRSGADQTIRQDFDSAEKMPAENNFSRNSVPFDGGFTMPTNEELQHLNNLRTAMAYAGGLYTSAQQVKDTVVEAFARLGAQAMDVMLGYFAYAGEAAAPFDMSLLRGFFAMRCFSDLALLPSRCKEALAAGGYLLLDPCLVSLAKVVEKVSSLAQIATRAGYLAAMMGIFTFPPALHFTNIVATGVCGLVGMFGAFTQYQICLLSRRANNLEGAKEQIPALLRMAANASLIAFAALSAQATSLSLLPLTAGTGAALAISAAFGITAEVYTKLINSDDVRPMQRQHAYV